MLAPCQHFDELSKPRWIHNNSHQIYKKMLHMKTSLQTDNGSEQIGSAFMNSKTTAKPAQHLLTHHYASSKFVTFPSFQAHMTHSESSWKI